MELIRLEGITKTYHLGQVDVSVLKGISLSIHQGEMVALMGASGSGKTTLMNILGCLDRPSGGRYWLEGQEISTLSPNERAIVRVTKIGFVFQNFNLLPRTPSLQNVVMPLDYGLHRPAIAKARESGRKLLEHVGLADRMDHEPSQMSGGQQQRVAIARALINAPLLLLADEPTGNLDSHTSVEILRMFQRLNSEGLTVVLVTHDPRVATYAHRVIHMTDGLIEGEEAGEASDAGMATQNTLANDLAGDIERARGPERAPESKPSPDPRNSLRHHGLSLLIPSTVRSAIVALRRNKLRSALTALGVIIGVGAVIAMTEIGEGSKAAMQQTIASMGANNLMMQSGAATSSGISFGGGTVMTLTPADAVAIAHRCPSVDAVAPTVHARAQVICGNRNWSPASSDGTTPDFLAVRDWNEFIEGEMFTERDVQLANAVCVIGHTVRRELFAGESAVGKDIRIRNVPFRIVGVLGRKGANMMGTDQDDIVLAPWTTIKYRVSAASTAAPADTSTTSQVNTLNKLYPGSTPLYPAASASQAASNPQLRRFANVDHIFVKVNSAPEIPEAIREITEVLRERHRLHPGDVDDFNIRDMTEMTTTLASTAHLMGVLLLALATISLIVGGVGIMNIMLVSVTERTREIGLRMAVGARSHHILRQFLVEAILLCLFGGILGIGLGRIVSLCVRSIMSWPTQPSLLAILTAVGVSATVGIAFGFYPAWKASRLDPIESLRYE